MNLLNIILAASVILAPKTVSRNEFGITETSFRSPDGTRDAIYLKDESAVSEFPLLDIRTRTGVLKSIKYPMNGMASERLGLAVCDTLGHEICRLDVTDFTEERYLAGITWSPDSRYIFVSVIDREQHHMRLNQYRADNGKFVRTLLTEENDAWIEPLDPLYFVKGTYKFIYRTDNRDGYRNLYLCDTLGSIRRLTPVDADVAYLGNDGKNVYYSSAEVSPVENHLFRARINGKFKPVRLTPESGWHRTTLSSDFESFTDTWSCLEKSPITLRRSLKDGHVTDTLEMRKVSRQLHPGYKVELGTVKSADGKFDNYYRLVTPEDLDPEKKYPLIVYVYGGPHSQMVRNSYMAQIRSWEVTMAKKGYILYIQDNRGTSNRGAEFEKAINRQCGQAEMADQLAGLQALLDRSPWIDRSRIGVHGWSYGGFMTMTLMTNNPGLFKVGAAGGPVIDWKWYEVMYGERYMDNPESNPEGFKKTSLMEKTSDLKDRLLILQGAMDSTVVWQHSLSFVQKCIEEGVQLEYFPYPCDEHNMRGKAREHLYHKLTEYFTKNL